MAHITQAVGPPAFGTGAAVPLEKCQAHFELGVALSLNLWPALTLAVQDNWGDGDAADKRDWFAGAIVDLFDTRPDTDMQDVEEMLLQVMWDEFEVNVADESAFEVAEEIMELRNQCGKGDFQKVEAMKERWQKKGAKGKELFKKGEENQDAEWDSDDSGETEDEDEDEDVEMGEAPPPKEKVAPEVDEDGFTKVMGKKKR